MVRIPGALTENGPCKLRVTYTYLCRNLTLWTARDFVLNKNTHSSIIGIFSWDLMWCRTHHCKLEICGFFLYRFFLPVRWFIRSLHFIKAKLPLRPQNCGIAEITRYAPLSKIIEDLQQKYKLVSSLGKHYYDNRLRGNDKRLINCTGP